MVVKFEQSPHRFLGLIATAFNQVNMVFSVIPEMFIPIDIQSMILQ